MKLAFSYEREVTGRDFLGRRQECLQLKDALIQGRSVALYAAPKTGKSSLIHEVIQALKQDLPSFTVCEFKADNIIRMEDFVSRFISQLQRAMESSGTLLQGLLKESACSGDDYRSLFLLPSRLRAALSGTELSQEGLSADSGSNLIIIIEEFQRLGALEEFPVLLRALRDALKELRGQKISYLFVGSQINEMKSLFVRSSFFGEDVQPLTLSDISENEIHDYIRSCLNQTGKVMEKDAILSLIRLFENNIWHIKHYMSLCDSLTRGYINEAVSEKALAGLVSSQLPYLNYIASHLTCFQLRFLRALIDQGRTCNFSSSKILEQYELHSSANVVRVRQALMKKEIISEEKGKGVYIIDPLFRYWLEKYFFQ
ncbi:MAG: ATP-binding protein [Bacteroidales bacterium]|nr:ATP-binding protein [Bacteroidales bacterium]